MTDIVFIGAGGHAKVVFDVANSCGVKPKYFIDSNVNSFRDLNKILDADIPVDAKCIIAIGGTRIKQLQLRMELFNKYNITNPIIAKSATIGFNCIIGLGTVIFPSSIINSDVHIGNNVIVNTGAIIEHDVIIEDGAHICPGAIVLGGAKVCKNALIGAGAIILPNVIVPENTLIKANSRFNR